jgi:hypothetical protein
MLKKDFKFLYAFDKLEDGKFGVPGEKVKYFGTSEKSEKKLRKNIDILFYTHDTDFAVKLHTTGSDEVFLYRTNDDKPFEQFYTDMNRKTNLYYTGSKQVRLGYFKAPDISLFKLKNFDELCGKPIQGTGFLIAQAIESIDFKMNNEGVKLKSEAAITTVESVFFGDKPVKDFYFNDKFVVFLKEKDKTTPYFALRAADVSLINKTGKQGT